MVFGKCVVFGNSTDRFPIMPRSRVISARELAYGVFGNRCERLIIDLFFQELKRVMFSSGCLYLKKHHV